jgi:rhodanese-related sulfurtransferase
VFADVPSVAVAAVDEDGPDLILDVRETEEWAAGRIASAVHISMYDVPQHVGALPADRKIIVVCKVGGRSAQVTAWLRGRGFDAHNLDGGMLAWAVAHRPMVTDLDIEPFVV